MGFELNAIVEDVTALTRAHWQALAQRDGIFVALRRSLRDGLPPCDGDAATVRDTLLRLMRDAGEAMPQGGTLTIRTGSTRRGDGKREAYVEIRDSAQSGVIAALDGMPQTRTGGLSVQALPGGGTAIRMAFAAAGRAHKVPGMPAPVKILLIDDDLDILDSTQILLELDGHDVAIAGSGAEGVAAAHAAHEAGAPFDVVITDLGMPGMDGHDVASAIKQARPATHVILMTGWGDSAGRGTADFVIAKPPKPEEINRLLARCAGG